MSKRSKRYKLTLEKISKTNLHPLETAVEELKNFQPAKFDETVELSIALGVDPKQSSQAVRGTVNLPHGSGKQIKVLVFTDKPEDALSAGADFAGLVDIINKIKAGWTDFDVALSTTNAMKEVRSIARILGPRGLMPTPKAGTVTDDLVSAIKEVKAGRVEFKMDKTGSLAVLVGKHSFSATNLQENALAAIDAIKSSRPDGLKGKFIKRAYLSSTMSPSIPLELSNFN